MAAQADGHGHLRHVLPAHQLGADAGQLALVPLRMRRNSASATTSPSTASPRNSRRSLSPAFAGSCSFERCRHGRLLVGQGAMRQRAHQQLRPGKAMPECGFQFARAASTCASTVSIPVDASSWGRRRNRRFRQKQHPIYLLNASRRLDGRPRWIIAASPSRFAPEIRSQAWLVAAPDGSSSASSSQLWPLTA